MLHNLKKLREEAGITQRALAEAIAVSQQSINKYENHNIEPDIATMIQIAKLFNTSVDYLVGHSDIRRKIEVVHPYDLTQPEAELIEKYRCLTGKQRLSIQMVIENYQDPKKTDL